MIREEFTGVTFNDLDPSGTRISRSSEFSVVNSTKIVLNIPHKRESFIFHNRLMRKHKRKKTTIAWRVARKANQPIKAGDPLSFTPVTTSKTDKAVREGIVIEIT